MWGLQEFVSLSSFISHPQWSSRHYEWLNSAAGNGYLCWRKGTMDGEFPYFWEWVKPLLHQRKLRPFFGLVFLGLVLETSPTQQGQAQQNWISFFLMTEIMECWNALIPALFIKCLRRAVPELALKAELQELFVSLTLTVQLWAGFISFCDFPEVLGSFLGAVAISANGKIQFHGEWGGGDLRDGLRSVLETNPGRKRRKNKHLTTLPVNNANLAQPRLSRLHQTNTISGN